VGEAERRTDGTRRAVERGPAPAADLKEEKTMTKLPPHAPIARGAAAQPGPGDAARFAAFALAVGLAAFGTACTETVVVRKAAPEPSVLAEPDDGEDPARAEDGEEGADHPSPAEDTSMRKRVFVLSSMYAGAALGGPRGADAKCQTNADAAGLKGTFRSGVVRSDQTTPILEDEAYYLVDRETLVTEASTNLASSIVHPIDMTEKGEIVVSDTPVWTGALSNCDNWQTDNPYMTGTVGLAGSLEKFAVSEGRNCVSATASMYCFEQ
jgi:hypothetical protein